ncbi:hypothetical protein [Achromobacter spanius]|uniref:hypothetical protein n=1 Tax=Achromobacter spanius TaxID=217203 RepID=UPI0038288057
MATFEIAHLREQGQDIIIIPLESSFGLKASTQQQKIVGSLQLCAQSAGLAGTVVPVWLSGQQVNFIAPRPWHPFFRSLSWAMIHQNLNKTLTCN